MLQARGPGLTLIGLLVSHRVHAGGIAVRSVDGSLGWAGPERLTTSRTTGHTRSEPLGHGEARTLDSQRLAHDRAAARGDLQIGHWAATAHGGTSSSREAAQSRAGGVLEERAHSAGLLEERLHGD